MPQHLYKLVQNNNEHMQEAYQKWYARPVYTGTLDLNGIAELISRPSCKWLLRFLSLCSPLSAWWVVSKRKKKGAPECRMLPLLWINVDGLCLFLSSPVHLGLTDTDSCLRTLFLCESNSFGSDVEAQISEQNATNDRIEFLQTTEQNHYKWPNKNTTNNRKSIE